MRLKKIILNGFKSFADKTDFSFEAPITAIVGPNGCGKSNVVDAVKWVLGEQSVKSLRSGQMADVIFSGSSSRKPMGSAEVTLIMSNPEGSPGRLPIDSEEVSISRKIYRSGESEYRINKKTCRLKDIREMFMDTGIGTRAYSIIEQGQIDQVLSASKVDRRALFEEAAGISKYKAHKKEALRKLDRTEQNLLRLADILGEVTKRLRSVKLAAGKARNYLAYTDRLKELQVNYSLVEYDRNCTLLAQKREKLDSIQEQFASVASEVSRNDSLISRLGNEIIETEHKLNQASNSLVSVQSRIEQQLQRIEFLRSRSEELQQRKKAATDQIAGLDEQRDELRAELHEKKRELNKCDQVLESHSGTGKELEAAISELNAECVSLEAELEDEKSGIIDIVRRTAQLHNEIQSISVYRNNLASQKDRLAGRAETARAELESLLTEKAQNNARLEDIERVLGELEDNLEAKKRKRQEIEKDVTAANKRLANSKEARSALNSELGVLTDMERRYEGLTAGVKTILENQSGENARLDYVEGILANIVEADIEYANAVEAALEGKTDAVVISDTERLLADGETIEQLQGRVDFLGTDRIQPFADSTDFSQVDGVLGRAVEFVKFDGRFGPLIWQLLGKTLVIDSMATARTLAAKLGGGYAFVTLKGESLCENGVLRLGPLGKTTGLISRKSRMRQLKESIANITAEITELEGDIDNNIQTKEHLDKLCKELRTAIYEANTEKTQAKSSLAGLDKDIKRLREEQPLIAGEMDQLEGQINKSVQQEYDSQQKLQELETVNAERTDRIEELETQLSSRKAMQQAKVGELTELRVMLGQMSEQSKALTQLTAGIENQLQTNNRAGEKAREEIATCTEQHARAQSDILACEAQVSELFVAKEGCQGNNRRLQEEIQSLTAEQRRAEQMIRDKRQQKGDIEEQISRLKVELGQLEVKLEDLVERVQEELQIDLRQAYQNFTEDDTDWRQVKDEIIELRGKIERLGNVNLDAIEEQENLEERHEFLTTQLEDLNRSKAQLQQLIAKLNKQSREKFREAFEDIRAQFQQIFRKLFGGGKADILLEDAEDILDAGIEIVAKPPGKETRSISLLSGGEKSMTAMALMFAVYKSRPSPFCFLDEVDAALDEANNERFNILLKEFESDSQFIVITHSKRTMSISDVLFGVTMQTRGVSKKISVRFDDYDMEDEEEQAA